MRKTCVLLTTVLLGGQSLGRADATYIYLAQQGFQTFDTALGVIGAATSMAMGTVGDPATILGKDSNILSEDMQKLNLNDQELATLASTFDNLGVRQSAEGAHANTALLDRSIKFGDLNDRVLTKALSQAEAMGLDPNALQALGQTVYGTAKIQAFDETLRAYERMGGSSLGLQERQALKAQVDTLNYEQLNWETINSLARERLKAHEAQKKQMAGDLGKRVVQSAARQGVVLQGEWEEYSPPWDQTTSPGLYDYGELGGMASLHNPDGSHLAAPTSSESSPFTSDNPLVSTGKTTGQGSQGTTELWDDNRTAFPHQGEGANADPSTLPTGQYSGDTDAALRQIGTYNVGYDRSKNGWCARGVSKTLEAYSGMPITSTSGANAKHMGPILQNKFGMRPVTDTGVYRNGDTRVLQNRGAGHIETYFNGTWSSDHVQRGPSTGNPRYSSAQLYRFP